MNHSYQWQRDFGKMNTTPNSICDVLLDLTNSAFPSYLQHSHREQIIANVLWSFFLTFGLLTNATFIVVVAKIPYMQNVTNAYLCNLAISDLVYLISTGADALLQYNWSTIPGDDTGKGLMGCRVLTILSVLCFMESTILVTLVTFERFVAIRFPLSYRHVKGPKRTSTLIFISWIVSLLLAVSALPVLAGDIIRYCVHWPKDPVYQNHQHQFQFCTAVKDSAVNTFPPILWILVWLSLVIFNITMYIGITRTLKKRANSNIHSQRIVNTAEEESRQVVNMLIVNGLIFWLCWAFNAGRLIETVVPNLGGDNIFDESAKIRNWLYSAIFALNACVNPIVYNVTNRRYRNAFKQCFCPWTSLERK